MGFLTGSQKSTQGNQGFGFLKDTFAPVAQQGAGANNFIAQLLGLQGGDQGKQAYQAFQNSTGFQSQMKAGQDAITSSASAKGLLNSGATLKGLTEFGQNLGKQSFENFLSQLGGVGDRGLQAGGVIGGAGSTSKSTQKQGLLDAVSPFFNGG